MFIFRPLSSSKKQATKLSSYSDSLSQQSLDLQTEDVDITNAIDTQRVPTTVEGADFAVE